MRVPEVGGARAREGGGLRSRRPGPRAGLYEPPAPRPRKCVWVLCCLSFLSLQSRTQVPAAPGPRCGGEARPGPARDTSGGDRGEGREMGRQLTAPSEPGRCPRPGGAQAPRPQTFPAKWGWPHPGEGDPHASPTVPWGWSLTGRPLGLRLWPPPSTAEEEREEGEGEGEEGEGPEPAGVARRGGGGYSAETPVAAPPPPRSLPAPLLLSLPLSRPGSPQSLSGV